MVPRAWRGLRRDREGRSLKKSVKAAVQAGLSWARTGGLPPAEPAAPVQPPPTPVQPPLLWRRASLRLVRGIRPLFLPFLNRLQFRMRTAVDTSEAIARIERRSREQFEQLAVRLEQVAAHAQFLERIERSREEADTRLARIDLILDVAERRLSERADLLSSRLEQIEAVLARLEGNAEVLTANAAATLEKLDLILQRVIVPSGDAFALRTDAGYVLAPAEDLGLVLFLLESRGRPEPGTSAVLHALARPGGVVIDVGANVGVHTLSMARQVGPAGHVLALEPAARVADLLSRTVHMNGLGWVDVRPVAASEEDGTLRFNLSAQTTHNSILPLDDVIQTIDIPACRLDTMVAPGGRVDLVKIDVEGAELHVWRGMQRIVADNPGIALVLEFGPDHLRRAGQGIDAWFEELQSTGLTAWEIDEAALAVRPLRAEGLNEVYTINVLLLRDSPASRGLKMQ